MTARVGNHQPVFLFPLPSEAAEIREEISCDRGMSGHQALEGPDGGPNEGNMAVHSKDKTGNWINVAQQRAGEDYAVEGRR